MSLSAIRHVAFAARRTFIVDGSVETKRADGGEGLRTDRDQLADEGDIIALEPHWQASIESATD